ncbi:MAG TPA: polysaccharide deacetylase family protein, partial [Alphaproteobacteria bacterium]|nr:polysaccharide deacetylase family protein [Alphaproteobacteria bacterium]
MSWQIADVPGPKRDLVGYGRYPPRVRWPDNARVAVSLVINYEAGSELSHELGDGRTDGLVEVPFSINPKYRDFGTESMFEYESRAGIWRLQRLFDAERLPATFFACAVALERNPEVGAWIREAGHEPCGHGWRWEQVWRLSEEQEREHLRLCIESIEKTCGDRPRGWYCRYSPSPNTRALLVEQGFEYDCDAYNDDLPYHVDVGGRQHLVVPYNLVTNDVRFLMPQGDMAPADWADFLCRAYDCLWQEGETHPRMMSVGLHPRIIG